MKGAKSEGGWQAYVFADCGLMERLAGRDSRVTAVDGLYSAVRSILEDAPGITFLHIQ